MFPRNVYGLGPLQPDHALIEQTLVVHLTRLLGEQRAALRLHQYRIREALSMDTNTPQVSYLVLTSATRHSHAPVA